ncbi:hypothetical protein ACN9MG_12165 [Burkholderia ambifaria]|uniref:hypothetical protein n=1 Tax=Burkholderia ambifaria TaxID=152480 RepID=UPI003CF9B93F
MAGSLTNPCEHVMMPRADDTSRMWLDMCAAFEDARQACSDAELLGKAVYLERMSAALWGRGDRSCCISAIQAMQIAQLIVDCDEQRATPRTVLASELQGAVLDLGDALDSTGCLHSDPMVQNVDLLTELLWSRGDDQHARAAVRLQRIAVTLIQNGVRV